MKYLLCKFDQYPITPYWEIVYTSREISLFLDPVTFDIQNLTTLEFHISL